MFRILQGVFGASLVPLSQALMMDAYTREEQGKAMAMWGVGTMLGPISGPTLGGWLTDEYSWRWVFYINLPVGILCAIGLMILVKNKASDTPRPFDLLGFSLLAIAIGSFQLMLDRGEQIDWFGSKEIIVEAVVAGVAAVMFVLHMLSSDHPFLPRDLFRDRNLMLGLIFTAVTGLLMIVTATLLPPFLQQLKGYPVFTTGIVMAPRGIGTMISMFVVSRLIGKVDARWLIAIGLSLCAISLYDMTLFTLDVSEGRIVWNGFLQGVGLGLVFPPLTTLAFATVPAPHPHRRRGDERADAKSRRLDRRRRAGGAARPQHPDQPLRCCPRSDGVQPAVAAAPPRRSSTASRSTAARIIQHLTPLAAAGRTVRCRSTILAADRHVERGAQSPGGGDCLSQRFPRAGDRRLHLHPALFFMRRQAMLARPSRR